MNPEIEIKLSVKHFSELTTAELYEILKSRSEIFMLQQHIICQDMDDTDYNSIHCFFQEGKRITAYLRAYPKGNDTGVIQIGRVLTLRHGNGMGKRLLEESIPVLKAKMNCRKICLDSQKHAIGFYEKSGFHVTSDEFLEEGVLHVTMELDL